ncbi:MAG: hypothetical protein ACO1OG_11255 [Devosia sp.]
MSTPARRFPWWVYWLLLALILVFALAPLASVAIVSWIAEANGCALNEATINPCVVNGVDMGGTLYTFGVLGWLMLATIPLGAMALCAWLAILVIHWIIWRRRRAT